jgi:hypothetical protein
MFLWFYLPAYFEHRAFSENQIVESLVPRNASDWRTVSDFFEGLNGYDTLRSFYLVIVLVVLTWIPYSSMQKRARQRALWLLVVSIVVVLIPFRLDGFSIWMALFKPLPGFSVIRDPKRIIYVYELAAALAIGFIIGRFTRRSLVRVAIPTLMAVVMIADPNRLVFDFQRANDDYDRWVASPIEVDPSCASFFVRAASRRYSERSPDTWTLYAIDAMFVSLNHSLPTLNGYSAWSPREWRLSHPERSDYVPAVNAWIARHGLRSVCELDIERRTMRPYSGG